MNFSTSKKLISSVNYFFEIKHYTLINKLMKDKGVFYGWGRKLSGQKAVMLSERHHTSYKLIEDGFIRSFGLGVNGSPSFSLVEDDCGIYYDATHPSKLEHILNNYDFLRDKVLMQTAKEAMALIREYQVSKYNNSPNVDDQFRIKYSMCDVNNNERVLIIAQTSGDSSLEYGLAGKFTTKQMIEDAIDENPNASVYLKIHPDVLSGKKESDISINEVPSHCMVINEDINPISLLEYFNKVYTKTSGMGMEALILDKIVVCYGLPYYAGWGLTQDKQICHRRTKKLTLEALFSGAYILYTQYYNPYSKKKSDIIETIKSIVKYRIVYKQNERKLYFFGFSIWKRRFTRLFFQLLKRNNIIFCSSLKDSMRKGIDIHSKIYIWGKKPFPEVEKYAKDEGIDILRVEDGFIRSVSLGSDLTKAYSLVVDSRGIYFDPTGKSDLEHILNTYNFDEKILERAKNLQQYLTDNKISKYNIYQDKQIKLEDIKEGQTIVVVPGQVEDDASIIYGANGMTNLELLQKARKNVTDGYIIYKPHPDVLVGNRKGHIEESIALKYCNTIIKEASLDSVLALSDEVHTMTSLVGFEALIRGKKVYTYGLPFYAAWGLTIDEKTCERRTVSRTLDELVAAAFILYPRYIDPVTNELCEIEVLLQEIDKEKNRYNRDKFYKLRIDSRNMISRKIQFFIKVIFGE